MNVVKEIDNTYDPSAMLVKVLKTVDSILLNKVTCEANAGRPQQIVKDIIGQTVGRVPANLCKVFRGLLKTGDIYRVSCFSKGKATISCNPRSSLQMCKSWGNDHRGGGAIIPSNYRLYCRNIKTYNRVSEFVCSSLKDLGCEKEILIIPGKEEFKPPLRVALGSS